MSSSFYPKIFESQLWSLQNQTSSILVKKLRSENLQSLKIIWVLEYSITSLAVTHIICQMRNSHQLVAVAQIFGVGFSDRVVVPHLQGECQWSRHRKQGVYFLRSPWESSGDGRAAVSYSFTFEPSSGDIKMDFDIKTQWCGASE